MRRISKDELYRREYRNKVALQESLKQTLLPKEKWTTPEQVGFFLPSSFFLNFSSSPSFFFFSSSPSFFFASFAFSSLCCCICSDDMLSPPKLGQEVPCTCAYSGAAWGWGEGGLQRPGKEAPLNLFSFFGLHERSLEKPKKNEEATPFQNLFCSL